jgi:hypothetical protein
LPIIDLHDIFGALGSVCRIEGNTRTFEEGIEVDLPFFLDEEEGTTKRLNTKIPSLD